MARFHLNIHSDDDVIIDDDGLDRPDVEAAKEEAIKGIRSLLCGELMEGKLDLRGHIEVADETGAVVEKVAFEDAVQIIR